MTESPESYGKALFQLGAGYEEVMECQKVLEGSQELMEALCNRLVTQEEKHRIIDCLFQGVLTKFLKYLCDNDCCDSVFNIFLEYEACYLGSKSIAKATLSYVHLPEDEQIEEMKKILCRDLAKDDILLMLKKDPSIIGGCVLTSGSYVYDRSVKGALQGLKSRLLWR